MSNELCVRALFKNREIKAKRLQKDLLVIGRDPECDIRLDNAAVSRHHARIEHLSNGYVLRDLGSANGTYVNGMAVAAWLLRPGDRIRISKFDLVVDNGGVTADESTEMVEFVPGLDDQNTIQVARPRHDQTGRSS